jgi:hypothetical protein
MAGLTAALSPSDRIEHHAQRRKHDHCGQIAGGEPADRALQSNQ